MHCRAGRVAAPGVNEIADDIFYGSVMVSQTPCAISSREQRIQSCAQANISPLSDLPSSIPMWPLPKVEMPAGAPDVSVAEQGPHRAWDINGEVSSSSSLTKGREI
jgi:hypothetical protein